MTCVRRVIDITRINIVLFVTLIGILYMFTIRRVRAIIMINNGIRKSSSYAYYQPLHSYDRQQSNVLYV